MALNLVRNSKVFFTTNVDSTTGIIKQGTAFTTGNTTEIQVLDGFTFSQNTNQDTVTISEAGTAPVRGQRSFNTSLAPVDFSFSNYLRPYKTGGAVTAEESVLWNALLSDQAISTGTAAGAVGAVTHTYNSTAGTSTLTFTGLSLGAGNGFSVGDVIIIAGLGCSVSTETGYFNAAAKVTAVNALTSMTVELINATAVTKTSTFTINATTTKFYKSAWAPVDSTYSLVTAGGSNKNQLQKFGMLFLVDQVLYAVDNCALNQVSIDFGLDAIATAAWTGQATQIRKLAEGSTAVTGTFAGNTVTFGAGTIGTPAGSSTAWTVDFTLTNAAALSLSVGATVTGTGFGTASVITSIATNASGLVTGFSLFSTATATAGSTTGGIATNWAGGAYTPKVTAAAYITNKLSTVKLTTLNKLVNAAGAQVSANGTEYALALTGGSLTINNNISYITPANLGVVNAPVTYYTGTRAITGTMNAYLKTGAGAQSTGQLLSDLLDASTVTTEPMFALTLNIGGTWSSTNAINSVALAMPSVMLTIPTVDVQQVVSTSINFTAQGSAPTSETASVYDLAKTNDIAVRYYGA